MLRWILSLGLLAATAPALAQPSPAGEPIGYFEAANFGKNGAGIKPDAGVLSAGEEAQLQEAVRLIGAYPAYIYSGCHDRAHATWLQLPAALQAKVMKIWVVTPARYAPAIAGSIRLNRDDPASKAVNWGHHVALAYRTAGGLKVMDSALNPGAVLSDAEWRRQLSVRPAALSFWTLTRGEPYYFFLSAKDAFAANEQVWTGNTFTYSGTSKNEHWIPTALARDAVGVDAVAGRACPLLNALATDPDRLQAALVAGPGAMADPGPCQPAFVKFQSEKARWITRLSGL